MSFDTKEISEYSGEPQELFWFMRGVTDWAYTSGALPVDKFDLTFEPLAGLSRSSIKLANERSRNQMTVTMPRDAELVKQFVGIPPQEAIWLNLYQIHLGETDYSLAWQGKIRTVEFKGNYATVILDTLLATNKKSFLRHLYQNQCNHFTFDANCTLSEEDYSHAGTIDSVDGVTIEVTDAQATDYYSAGQIKRSNGDRRFIVTDVEAGGTHTLTLLTPFEDLEVGEAVTLIGGACKHTFETCPVDNRSNYGGYPKVPRKNPFRSFR